MKMDAKRVRIKGLSRSSRRLQLHRGREGGAQAPRVSESEIGGLEISSLGRGGGNAGAEKGTGRWCAACTCQS